MYKWCWVLLIFILLGSCLDNDICLRGADNALVIEFKKFSEGEAVPDTVNFRNIEAEGTNAVFYLDTPVDLLDTLQKVAMTINPYTSETLFTFNDWRGETQTLKVGYKTEVRFVSEECGSERLQYALKILETSFDSVRVVRNNLDKGRSTNIEIYN